MPKERGLTLVLVRLSVREELIELHGFFEALAICFVVFYRLIMCLSAAIYKLVGVRIAETGLES